MTPPTDSPPVFVAVTGASGAPYARLLLETLACHAPGPLLATVTPAGRRILIEELGVDPGDGTGGHAWENWLRIPAAAARAIRVLPADDVGAGPASGSFPMLAMAIVPCSMRTLAAIAHGLADNLVTRAADVCIKEGRRLVLAPRETPLSALHLENMLRLARLGVRIVPPVPAFYHHPETLEDAARLVVQKLVGQMGLDFPDPFRWEPAGG